MSDILTQAGAAALGSRFRRLAEKLVMQSQQVYQNYDVPMEPSWFPVIYSLIKASPQSVGSIAEQTGQSHPFISKTVAQLKKAGLIETQPSSEDKRVQLLTLSPGGQAMLPALKQQITDIGFTLNAALEQVAPGFLEQLNAVESLLGSTSLLEMVKAQRNGGYTLVPFSSEHCDAFYHLNRIWIERYFEMEPSDHASLGDPEGYIIGKGGDVLLLANSAGTICGTAALINMGNHCYELAKMAVADSEQGKGLGLRLGRAAIARAKEMGAKRLYLESNRRLEPAIHLYRKLGFEELKAATPSPYARADIQMELFL